MDIFLQQLVNGLTLGSVYAIVALGYTMVYGIVQLINFAHGEVVMVGAMVSLSVIAALAGTALPPLESCLPASSVPYRSAWWSVSPWSALPIDRYAVRRGWRL